WLIPMIDELPKKYRIPLKMADVEGKTQQEVADRLDLSLSGAKSRVQRGREKLGDVLAACCEVEFGEEGRAVAYRKREKENCDNC
ncbi:MAG: sigma factor-like helix-turn-helix DNA-binding protein, partial [Candidatus Halalkalibacterium sp. M3_1C_030]